MATDDLIKIRLNHQRRLAIIEQRIALEGRRADPADIVEAEDIKRKIGEINEKIYRAANNIDDNATLYTYDEVMKIVDVIIQNYKSAIFKSFKKVLKENDRDMVILYANIHRRNLRSFTKRFLILSIVVAPLFMATSYFGVTDTIMEYGFYIMGLLGAYSHGIYDL